MPQTSEVKFKETEIGMIPEDWHIKRLLEVAYYVNNKSSIQNFNKSNFISTENILSNREGVSKINSLPKGGNFTTFNKEDILFSNIRTYFKKLWISEFEGGCSNDVLVIRPKNKELNNKFLFYYLSQDSFFNYTVATSKGTKMPRGDKNAIMNFTINIPPIPEQQAIAHILSRLDEKIELLQKQNKTFEEMGQVIFKRWFIDEKRDDWEIERIGEKDILISDFVANGSFASLKENVSEIKETEDYAIFIRNVDLKTKLKIKRYVDKNSYDFLKKSKLFGDEVLISNVADVGSVFLCPREDKPMTLGNNLIFLRSKGNINYDYYLYSLFNSRYGQHLIDSITTGSAQKKFNKTDLRNLKLVFPDKETIDKFNKIYQKLRDKEQNNLFNIRIFSKLRDSLLPKLMSGKIRVPTK